MSMGLCKVPMGDITLRFYDHGSVDGDRVKLEWNGDLLRKDLLLDGEPGTTITVTVDEEDNFLNITALNEGSSPPNTDTIVVTPCRDGRSESFMWNMKTGQVQFLTIEGY